MVRAIIFASDNHATNNQKNEYMKMKTLLFFVLATIGMINLMNAQNLPNYLPTNGLIGWWPFNGNANDESGNGNDGIVDGAVLTNDRFGNSNKAYVFDGLNDGINIGASSNGTFNTNQMTFSVWANLEDYQDFHMLIWMNNKGIFKTNGNEIRVYDGNSFYIAVNNDDVNFGQWFHIAATYNHDTIGVFVNGNLLYQGLTWGNATINYSNDPIQLGFFQGSLYRAKGTLDDFSLYNRALSQQEITSIYNGEPTNPPTACNPLPSNLQNGLVGYWPFCGNANDESGNGNNGVVNGATLKEDRFGVTNAAYDFDGVNDEITVSGNDFGNGNFSVSGWINANASNLNDTQNQILIFGYDNGNKNLEVQLTNISQEEIINKLRFSMRNLISNDYDLISVNEIVFSEWTHFVIQREQDVQKFYVNGSLVGINSQITTNDVMENGLMSIGNGMNNVSGRYFHGTIDDIGIWNRALSADEVQQLYTLNACTFTIYDTVIVNNYVTIYDTVSVSTTDTLIINTLITNVQPAQENTILVYPNPANSHITIDYGNFAILNGYQLKIENALGQQVFQTNISQQSDYLSLSNWGGNGIYFVHVIDLQGNTIDIRKIVLQ